MICIGWFPVFKNLDLKITLTDIAQKFQKDKFWFIIIIFFYFNFFLIFLTDKAQKFKKISPF